MEVFSPSGTQPCVHYSWVRKGIGEHARLALATFLQFTEKINQNKGRNQNSKSTNVRRERTVAEINVHWDKASTGYKTSQLA